MTINDLKGQWRSILLVTSLLFLPPLLFSLGVIISSIIEYNGTCPGIMDIPAYPCTVWEYIGRNTISPFAFAAHLIVWIGWGFVSLLLGGLWFMVRAMRSPSKRG